MSGIVPIDFGNASVSSETFKMRFLSRPLVASILFATAIVATPAASAHDEKHDQSHPTAASSGSFGRPGIIKNVSRTVTFTLVDAMRFTPAAFTVKRGETLRLRISNVGKLPHEFVLGTQEEIEEHAAMMRQMPDMVHHDASSVRVAPGKSADIVWQFSTAGTFMYACLVPGHREAGMQGRISVTVP